MTSALSREDVRAKAYQSGVRNPRVLNELMRTIDAYALALMRRSEEQEEIPAPVFTPLEPGQWSAALEVTCCISCQQVKRWSFFHVDKRHATGHKTTCKDCRKKADEDAGKPPYVPQSARREGWLCAVSLGGCGKRRLPEEFPEAKRDHPRRPIPCLACEPVQE